MTTLVKKIEETKTKVNRIVINNSTLVNKVVINQS